MNIKFIILFIILFVVGCRANKTVIIPISSEIETLNPRKVISMEAKMILSAIYSPLFELRGMHPELKLVESWHYDSIKKTYFFELKKHILFHDETEMTVDDVVFSIHQWAANDSLDSHLLNQIKGVREYQNKKNKTILGVKKIDRYHFSIDMMSSNLNFINTLCLPRFVIQKKNFDNQNENKYFLKPIGTGPFKVTSFSVDKLLLNRFEKYFSKLAKAPSIEIKKMDFQEAIKEFNAKNIDLLLFYSLNNVEQIARKDVVVEILPPVSTITLVFPLNVKEHRDLFFRRNIVRFLKKSQNISTCIVESEKQISFLPASFLSSFNFEKEKYKDVSSSELTNFKKKIVIYLTDDLWNRCFLRHSSSFNEGKIEFKHGQTNNLFELFKKGQLGPFFDEFNFKNEDPMTVLQYFEPNTPEYLLAKPLPELTQLFKKIRQSKDSSEKSAYINLVFRFLENEYLAIPMSHPKNIRVYADSLTGVSQHSVFKQSQNWENLGY